MLGAIDVWIHLFVEDGVTADPQPYLDETAALFITHLGADETTANALAIQAFTDPNGFGDALKPFKQTASVAVMAAFVSDFLALLTDITADLEVLEAQYHTLDHTGTGHAPVSTTLTISGLCAGEHTVQWIDDNTGSTLTQETIRTTDDELRLDGPAFSKHVAFLVKSVCT